MKWLMVFAVVLILPTFACAQQEPALSSSERNELDACRKKIPEFLDQLEQCKTTSSAAYQTYSDTYWTQESAMRESTIQALSWQKFAGNFVLFLVVVLTLSGIALAAYQLHLSYRIGQKIEGQTLDISAQRAQVTSSVVGITILVIAGAFLLLFLNDVYKIEPLAFPEAKKATPN